MIGGLLLLLRILPDPNVRLASLTIQASNAGMRLAPEDGSVRLASLTIQASNAGMRLAPEDGSVYAYPVGASDLPLAETIFERPLNITPGRYDVRVLFSRSRDRQSIWLRDVLLEPDEPALHKVEFSAGEIDVGVTIGADGLEAGQILVYVFKSGEHDEIVTSMGVSEPVLLTAGAYDVRVVWSVDSEEKEIRWVHNVQVNAGLQSKLNIPINRGSLLVHARNAGAELAPGSVRLAVYNTGDLQEQLIDSGFADAPLGLATGVYDIKATFAGSHDKPSRWLRGVKISDGEIAEQMIEFSSGTVAVDGQIEAGRTLGRFEVYVYFYHAGDHQQPVTYVPAGEAVMLESGRYDLRAVFYRSNDQPNRWLRDFLVKPGETVEYTVSFPSGTLLVRAYDGGGSELIGDNVLSMSTQPVNGANL